MDDVREEEGVLFPAEEDFIGMPADLLLFHDGQGRAWWEEVDVWWGRDVEDLQGGCVEPVGPANCNMTGIGVDLGVF